MLAADGTISSLFMPCFMAGMMLVNISSLSDVSRLLTDTVVNSVLADGAGLDFAFVPEESSGVGYDKIQFKALKT